MHHLHRLCRTISFVSLTKENTTTKRIRSSRLTKNKLRKTSLVELKFQKKSAQTWCKNQLEKQNAFSDTSIQSTH